MESYDHIDYSYNCIFLLLQAKAKAQGLWNIFISRENDPGCKYGAGLSNVEFAFMAEEMARNGNNLMNGVSQLNHALICIYIRIYQHNFVCCTFLYNIILPPCQYVWLLKPASQTGGFHAESSLHNNAIE